MPSPGTLWVAGIVLREDQAGETYRPGHANTASVSSKNASAPTGNRWSFSFVGVLAPGVLVALDLGRLFAGEGHEIVLRGVKPAHVHGQCLSPL